MSRYASLRTFIVSHLLLVFLSKTSNSKEMNVEKHENLRLFELNMVFRKFHPRATSTLQVKIVHWNVFICIIFTTRAHSFRESNVFSHVSHLSTERRLVPLNHGIGSPNPITFWDRKSSPLIALHHEIGHTTIGKQVVGLRLKGFLLFTAFV